MRPIPALSLTSALLIAACAEETPPPQPAPPADRNFTATVNDQPVVGGTNRFECQIRPHGSSGAQHDLLTFTDDLDHTIQIGIARGSEQPGPRDVVDGMATTTGIAFGRPLDSGAELTAIVATANGAVVSGRFSARFDVANAAPGVTSRDPLIVKDAVFEQVECLDPAKLSAGAG